MAKLAHAPGRGKALSIRRLVGVLIIAAIAWGLFWLLFRSGLADPALAMITPIYAQAVHFIEDPLGIDWGGMLIKAASFFILHIGMLFFIFDESSR